MVHIPGYIHVQLTSCIVPMLLHGDVRFSCTLAGVLFLFVQFFSPSGDGKPNKHTDNREQQGHPRLVLFNAFSLYYIYGKLSCHALSFCGQCLLYGFVRSILLVWKRAWLKQEFAKRDLLHSQLVEISNSLHAIRIDFPQLPEGYAVRHSTSEDLHLMIFHAPRKNMCWACRVCVNLYQPPPWMGTVDMAFVGCTVNRQPIIYIYIYIVALGPLIYIYIEIMYIIYMCTCSFGQTISLG